MQKFGSHGKELMETSNNMFSEVCVQVIPPLVEIMKLCKSTKAHSILMDDP